MKYDIMSLAHRTTKQLKSSGDSRKYKELFAIALKIHHIKSRVCNLSDLNWLMNFYPTKYIDLSLLTSLSVSDRYLITGSIRNAYDLIIEHYVRPRTETEDNKMIGVMIESEIKSGIKINLS